MKTMELAASIIDVFEDYLSTIDKVIHCADSDDEKGRTENEDAAAIYGTEYYALEDTIDSFLQDDPYNPSGYVDKCLDAFDSLLDEKGMSDDKPQGESRDKIRDHICHLADSEKAADDEKKHYADLCTKAKAWSAAYYEQDAPAVTDEEYDTAMHEIRDIEARHPDFVTPDSPTQVVGGKRVIGIPVEHRVPMLSLLDVFSDDEVRSFVDSVKAEYPDATFSVDRRFEPVSGL